MTQKLTVHDHSRIFAWFTYVYPVLSRRAEGISLGINLNVNNACNWRCVYCQVEGLVRGQPEAGDVARLDSELDYMLNWIVDGDFIAEYAPPELRRFNDICLSGNGESTLSPQFLAVVEVIARLRLKYHFQNEIKTILISNGSEIDHPQVIYGLKLLAQNNGEIWFKVDRATAEGVSAVNQVSLHMDGVKKRLILAAGLCRTFIQTCMFRVDEIDPNVAEVEAYIKFVQSVKEHIAGVLLYSTARNPALPEGHTVSSVSPEFLSSIAKRLTLFGVKVKYYQ